MSRLRSRSIDGSSRSFASTGSVDTLREHLVFIRETHSSSRLPVEEQPNPSSDHSRPIDTRTDRTVEKSLSVSSIVGIGYRRGTSGGHRSIFSERIEHSPGAGLVDAQASLAISTDEETARDGDIQSVSLRLVFRQRARKHGTTLATLSSTREASRRLLHRHVRPFVVSLVVKKDLFSICI